MVVIAVLCKHRIVDVLQHMDHGDFHSFGNFHPSQCLSVFTLMPWIKQYSCYISYISWSRPGTKARYLKYLPWYMIHKGYKDVFTQINACTSFKILFSRFFLLSSFHMFIVTFCAVFIHLSSPFCPYSFSISPFM